MRTASHYKDGFLFIASLALALSSLACGVRDSANDSNAGGVVVVNAPATGEVRRVLVREGMLVSAGSPVIEIAVRDETRAVAPTNPAEDPQARAGRNIQAAQSEVEAARADVVRAQVEVQRLTPLVASGQASQGELDGARVTYDRAQQRLQRAQSATSDAQTGLIIARQQSQNSSLAAPVSTERLVSAVASSAGTVSAINVRAGERVIAGQPLATLRAEQR